MKEIEKAIRVNCRISKKANDWLDRRSVETGISKSSLISLAVENYIKETEVVSGMPKIIEELERQGIDINKVW